MIRPTVAGRRSLPPTGRRSSGSVLAAAGRVLSVGGPALFVLLALLFGGGSAAGLLSSGILEMLSALCLLAIALWPGELHPLAMARGLTWLLIALTVLVLAHLVLLPPALWSSLPGRGIAVEGYRMLGEPLPWLPLSLDPIRARASALGLLPGIAALFLVLRAPKESYFPLAATIVAVALPSILIGIAQVTGGPSSPFYFYRITNSDSAVGFFANANHFATLLLIALPMVAACALHVQARRPGLRRGYILTAAAAVASFLVLGIFIVGSLAGVLMAGPVLLASAAILRRGGPRRSWFLAGLAAAGLMAAAGTIASLSDKAPSLTTGLGTGKLERLGIARTGIELVQAYGPVGAGLGAFQRTYQAHEDLDQVTNRFVNHAHNDYLEVLIETGLPGALLLLVFILWWVRRSLFAWSNGGSEAYWKQAASICLGVVIIHSLVDYPARAGAILAIVGALCAILGKREVRANHLAA